MQQVKNTHIIIIALGKSEAAFNISLYSNRTLASHRDATFLPSKANWFS